MAAAQEEDSEFWARIGWFLLWAIPTTGALVIFFLKIQ